MRGGFGENPPTLKRCFGRGCGGVSGHSFTGQFPIGNAVGDFACRRAKLIIELDGGQHDLAADADAERTRMIEAHGYTVVRDWNSDVMGNLDDVLEDILRHLRIALD